MMKDSGELDRILTFSLLFFNSSDGAGRTGTYIAISNLLERLKIEQTVDVFQSMKIIRSSRSQLVENAVSIFVFRYRENVTSCAVTKLCYTFY